MIVPSVRQRSGLPLLELDVYAPYHGVCCPFRRVGVMAIWAQLGVYDDEAARKAEAAHLPVVMDACIKVAHQMMQR